MVGLRRRGLTLCALAWAWAGCQPEALFWQPVTYPIECGPGGLDAGDFDGDGDVDLATTCSNDAAGIGQADVLVNQGNGRFVAGEVLGAPVPYSAQADDFDGDGCDDLAVLSWDGQGGLGVHVQFGQEDGTFEELSIGGFDWYGAMASGDVTGDGLPDLFAPWSDHLDPESGLEILVAPDFSTRISLDTFTTRPILGDVDGDGHLDLTNGYWVMRGDGGGGFADPVDSAKVQYFWKGVVADLDGDGHGDLVMAGDDRVNVSYGDAEARLGPAYSYPGGDNVSVSDLDRDGHLDLVAGGSAIHVRHGGEDDYSRRTTVYVEEGGMGAMVLADLDGDGTLDAAGLGDGAVTVMIGIPQP